MNKSCLIFGASNLSPKEVEGKDVLEVGSLDVNGSLRPIIESWVPRSYTGIDIVSGPGVDIVLDSSDLLERFGNGWFDVVVTTEMLEHARDWQAAISNLKNVVKPGGILLITTRSYPFHYHAWPHDYWRYEKEDMEDIFSDFEILKIQKDWEKPGIFLKLRRPSDFQENELRTYKLYNIVTGTKVPYFVDNLYQCRNFKRMMRKKKWEERGQKAVLFARGLIKKLI